MATTEEYVKVGKRVFVGNLPFTSTWEDLKEKFQEAGNVEYAEVTLGRDGRSKGWGIVGFETPEQAVQAITTLNATDLGGRHIIVREDREDKEVQGESTTRPPRPVRPARQSRNRPLRTRAPKTENSSGLQIVVGNLPYAYTDDQLVQHFSTVSGYEGAQIAIGSSGRSRGFGTVKFVSPEAAQEAVKAFNEIDFGGRAAKVFIDRYA